MQQLMKSQSGNWSKILLY